jgi:hypothetical protein
MDVPDTPRGSDAPPDSGAYISASRICEVRPKSDSGSDDDDDEEASTDQADDTDWSDSDEEASQPQRPSGGIGPVQDSIWNARYVLPPCKFVSHTHVSVFVRFQQLVGLADTESKYQQLAHLAHDFQHAAEVYGRIIISERFVPVDYKTIKPLDIGTPSHPAICCCRNRWVVRQRDICSHPHPWFQAALLVEKNSSFRAFCSSTLSTPKSYRVSGCTVATSRTMPQP